MNTDPSSSASAGDDTLTPRPEHRFTFGLWTVGNPGHDPFGGPTRAPLDPVDSVGRLAELGAWGVSLHDEDLVPYGAPAAERDRIVARFANALRENGMRVGMATTNLFGHPAFKDGAFTSNDRGVRRAAIGKAMRALDLGAELDAEVFVFWGGREGTEVGIAKDPCDALDRYREAVNVLADYAVGQALWAGKLFHVDLNAQRIGRYDQDFRFGAEDLKEAFLLVRLIERAGYAGPRHFDAHSYRNEDAEGVWDFARGCMRTYLALAERARHFDALPEVAGALAAASAPELGEPSTSGTQEAEALKGEADGLDRLAERGYANEALDQLLVEVLLGVR